MVRTFKIVREEFYMVAFYFDLLLNKDRGNNFTRSYVNRVRIDLHKKVTAILTQ